MLLEIGRAWVTDAPDDMGAHFLLGVAQLEADDIDGAEASFERVRALKPDGPPGYIGLARVARAREDRQAERGWLEEATAREGALPGAANFELALLQLRASEIAQGRATLGNLPLSFLNRSETQIRLALAEQAAGETRAAWPVWQP